jgi:LPS-assembly lipoprotein
MLAGLALVALVAGCGFHLRGEIALAEDAQPIYINSVSAAGAGTVELRRVLQGNGIAVAVSPEAAATIVDVRRDDLEERVLAVSGTTAKAEHYRLVYTLAVSARRADGSEVIPEQIVTRLRDYDYDASQVLSKHREREEMRTEMARDVVMQVLRLLETRL